MSSKGFLASKLQNSASDELLLADGFILVDLGLHTNDKPVGGDLQDKPQYLLKDGKHGIGGKCGNAERLLHNKSGHQAEQNPPIQPNSGGRAVMIGVDDKVIDEQHDLKRKEHRFDQDEKHTEQCALCKFFGGLDTQETENIAQLVEDQLHQQRAHQAFHNILIVGYIRTVDAQNQNTLNDVDRLLHIESAGKEEKDNTADDAGNKRHGSKIFHIFFVLEKLLQYDAPSFSVALS